MTIDPNFTDNEPEHAASTTSTLLDELQLYGHRPFEDELDSRPLPEVSQVTGAIADIFDALASTFQDTRLEPDLDDLLWSTVNVFHRATERIERELDDNEQAQKRGQREQDGSEVKSVELEQLLAQGLTLIERRNAFELMRDLAAEHFQIHTRNTWHPRTGSMVNRKHLTSAMIDSRDFLMARRRAETEVMLPAGPKIGFTGGYECNDTTAIWAALDRVNAKHPGMVLLHGGSPKGAERIALELRGKLPEVPGGAAGAAAAAAPAAAWQEQVSEALVGLGYSAKQSAEAVATVADEHGPGDVSGALRAALQVLAR